MNVPIYKYLKEYYNNNPLPFHMPGHILGRGLIGELAKAGSIDITEIPGSDCLHCPTGIIKQAQDLAAHCFGADYSFFLVNGSTSGIHIMVNTVVKPGGKLIIGRDCHKSVLNALALVKAEPVFVYPKIDKDNQIPLGISFRSIEQALKDNPDAQGILITRPNYYGVATPLEDIKLLAQRYSIPLLVDEAHGTHFIFHKNFPRTALQSGADLCVQSVHKTLPAFTQTALLHGKDRVLIDRKQVERFSSMIQTTSPSYLLMSSIDIARDTMEREGYNYYQKLWENIENFERKLIQRTAIRRIASNYADYNTDFSRIVLSFKNTTLNGYQAEEILNKRYGVVVEMADLFNIVIIATPFHTEDDFNRLLSALEEITDEYYKRDIEDNKYYLCSSFEAKSVMPLPQMPQPETVVPLHEALYYNNSEMSIIKAVGKISSDSVVPYPPGIPLLNPGEMITSEIAHYLLMLLNSGCPIHGVHDGKLSVLTE